MAVLEGKMCRGEEPTIVAPAPRHIVRTPMKGVCPHFNEGSCATRVLHTAAPRTAAHSSYKWTLEEIEVVVFWVATHGS